jgi:flagellar motor protein MotB
MKTGIFKRQRTNTDEENPYWISFSDIMAGLLIIFVLASLVLILELIQTKTKLNAQISDITKAEENRRTILYRIKKELLEKGITVEVSENDSVIRIPDQQLNFDSNEYKIPEQYKNKVLEIGKVISNILAEKENTLYFDTIFIEGHTDRLKTSREMGNWGLSTFRAISIWNYWGKKLGNKLSRLKNKDNIPLFSMSGYAETRPAQKTLKNKADRAKNRRIDIRFTIKRPTTRDIKGVMEVFGEKNEK